VTLWKAQRTLLIVGEGDTECAFLQYTKHLYVQRGCGLSVTIKNARGKGAKHVIDWTIRQMANAEYDSVAALLDTDTDWTPAVRKRAQQKKITLLTSEPCFEGLMLRVLGQSSIGNADTLKKKFAPYVNHDSTRSAHYAKNLGQKILETSRARERTIDALLKLLGA